MVEERPWHDRPQIVPVPRGVGAAWRHAFDERGRVVFRGREWRVWGISPKGDRPQTCELRPVAPTPLLVRT